MKPKILVLFLLLAACALGQNGGSLTGGSFSTSTSGLPQPCITSGPPPNGVKGQLYNAVITASCGTAPYSYVVLPDPPIPGTTFTSAANQGTLAGVPSASGQYGLNVVVTDANGQTVGAPYTIKIVDAITITSGNPPGGSTANPYVHQMTATGGNPDPLGNYTWSVISGSLPTNVTLNSVTGKISGTPTVPGTSHVQIRCTDSFSNFTDSPNYTIVITASNPQINNPTPPPGISGNFYTFTFTAFCPNGGCTFSATGSIPAGLTLHPNGVMDGTLGLPNNYNFVIIATDVLGQTGSQGYLLAISSNVPTPGVVSTFPALPQVFPNPQGCLGKTTNTINFPADGLGMHGGTPYATTQAGFNQALADANTKRDSDGSGTAINMPITTLSGAAQITPLGSNSATGANSTNCITITTVSPQTPYLTACSIGTRPYQQNDGCTNSIAHMWTWSQTSSLNPAMNCNNQGSSGPVHHFQITNTEIRDDIGGPVGQNGVALAYCGTNTETSESQQPHDIYIMQNYFHGYTTPNITALRGIFYSMHDSVIAYNYFEKINGNAKEGQGIATQQSSRVLVLANWISGGSEGSMIGGSPPTIAGYTPSDFTFRRNMFTRDYADINVSRCGLPNNYVVKNRFEIKNAQRVLIDGNTFQQSWCDGQSGFLMLLNVRALSGSCGSCTLGNISIVADITVTNNVFAHAAQGIQTDASSGGSGTFSSSGFGQALKMRRVSIINNEFYDIGDFTRYPAVTGFVPYTAVLFQLGASSNGGQGGPPFLCNLTRNGAGTIATAVCPALVNVPGTGMDIGDPVKLSSCTPDTGFNVGTASVGPPVLSGAPNSLTFTFANTGTANGTASCTLDNSAGAPQYFTINHNSTFAASNSASFCYTEGVSPNFQYPRSSVITNNICASNGGNPGGFAASAKAEGTATENLWDVSTLHFNTNVLTGRKSSSYTTYQNGETVNAFPGNGVGLQNNPTGIVCPTGTPDSGCLGIAMLMNGVPYNSNPSDYHAFALRTDSVFAAGKSLQASDGLQRGADINQIDSAFDSQLYKCLTPCGTGPFPDAAGVFLVASGGDNVDGCTFDKPCDSFAAAQTAVQLLPTSSQAAFLHTGTYRLTSTLTFGAGDSGEPQEDMVNWWMPTLKTSQHLTGTSLYEAQWLDADGQKFWLIKNSAGNPWDIDIYDRTNIYYWITENHDEGADANPRAWKRFITPVPLMPRFVTPGVDYLITSTGPVGAANQVQRTVNCESDGEPIFGIGDTAGFLHGPTTIAWGGSVGTQPTYTFNYYSSGNAGLYHNREERSLVKPYGSVNFLPYTCAGGCTIGGAGWVAGTPSLTNTVTAGAAPTPNWPCGTAFPWWIGGPVGSGGNVATPGGGSAPTNQVLWRNSPGESPALDGRKQVTGFSDIGSCGTNCEEYTVSIAKASWQNFESLWYNGNRRPRPTSAGATPLHGYAPNACPTSTTNPATLCKAGANQAAADAACGCTHGETPCAGLQTKVCTIGGATPWQCFNKYLYSGTDIDATWHGVNVGLVEILDFESWTMARMRVATAAAGLATFTGPTGLSNDHGCQGGHYFLADNVKEAAAKGQWYLDLCPTGACGGTAWVPVFENNWTLHIYADTSIGENPLTAVITVPQLDPTAPQVITGTSTNYLAFQGLQFGGDNWFPGVLGLGDAQGQPQVTGALQFTNSNFLIFDTDTVQGTTGVGIDFQATSTHNMVQNSLLDDLGSFAIRFGTSVAGSANAQPSDTDANVPQYETVQNNLVVGPQRIQPSGFGGGIFSGDLHHSIFTHNTILYPFTGGIELCFGLKRGDDAGIVTQQFFCHDNTVSFNLIVGAPNALMTDFGLIYSAPSYSTMCPAGTPLTGNPCNIFKNNYLKNAYSNYDLAAGAASSGGRGFYCDQGCTNILLQSNLIVRAGHSAIFMNQPQINGPNHFLTQNNLVDNNILGQCGYVNAGFTANLPTGCIAKNGVNGGAFTFQHNINYMNLATAINHFQNLVGSWPCFSDDGTTPATCVSRFVFSSNAYWNKSGTNLLAFATCKSVAEGATALCAAPFIAQNYFQYSTVTPGQIPNGWTNPWVSNGAGAGEDNGSVAADPVFVDPTCATDNWTYSHSFAPQGMTVFDYTQAGRLSTNTFAIPTVPDIFPNRPVNCLTDF